MTVFLDTNFVIYLIEQTAVRGAKALARFQSLQTANDQLAVSDLVRLECRVGPLKRSVFLTNDTRLSRFVGITVEVLT